LLIQRKPSKNICLVKNSRNWYRFFSYQHTKHLEKYSLARSKQRIIPLNPPSPISNPSLSSDGLE
jgi:hypothetical protein